MVFQVCPICAATLGKDAIGHFTVQHAHSVKVNLLVLFEINKIFMKKLLMWCRLNRGGESHRSRALHHFLVQIHWILDTTHRTLLLIHCFRHFFALHMFQNLKIPSSICFQVHFQQPLLVKGMFCWHLILIRSCGTINIKFNCIKYQQTNHNVVTKEIEYIWLTRNHAVPMLYTVSPNRVIARLCIYLLKFGSQILFSSI